MTMIAVRADEVTQALLRKRNPKLTDATDAYATLLALDNRAVDEDDIMIVGDSLRSMARIVAQLGGDPDAIEPKPGVTALT